MTVLTRFFRTDSTTGGDGTEDRTDGATRAYESLEALLTGESVDLTIAGDILHAICTQSGQEAPITTYDLSDITTGAADYLLIECQGDARHNGVSRLQSGTGFQMSRAGDTLRGNTGYYRFIGFEFRCSGTSYAAFEDYSSPGSSSDRRFDECLFVQDNAGSNPAYACDISDNAVYALTNCLAISRGQRVLDVRGTVSCRLDHVGCIGAYNYCLMVDNSCNITNTYALEGDSEDWYSSTATGSHNASKDGTATPSANEQTIVAGTTEFTNYTSDPNSSDLTLKDVGGVLVANGTGSEGIDITGTARSGTPDIGPFNFGAAGRDVTGITEALSLATNAAAINRTRQVDGLIEVLALTESPATVNRSRGVDALTEALVLAEAPAGVNRSRDVAAITEALVLAELPAGVNRTRDVAAITEALLLATSPAAVNRTRLVAAITEALVLTENAATVERGGGRTVECLTEALQLATVPATVNRSRLVAAITEQLVLAESVAGVNRSRDVAAITEEVLLATSPAAVNRSRLVDALTEALVLTENAATVERGGGRTVACITEALQLATVPATVNRSRLVAGLTEALILAESVAGVNRSRDVAAITEEVLLATSPADVGRSRLVSGLTEALLLTPNQASVVAGALFLFIDYRFVKPARAAGERVTTRAPTDRKVAAAASNIKGAD